MMRMWSFAPELLDQKGLGGVWNEGVSQLLPGLQGKGKAKRHSGLERWKQTDDPELYAMVYLHDIWKEASLRGYNYNLDLLDKTSRLDDCILELVYRYKFPDAVLSMPLTEGQLEYEWHFYLSKLKVRNPERYADLRRLTLPKPHPIFYVIPGEIEPWERVKEFSI